MATNANWTVIFEDKMVIKNNGAEAGTGYVIDDNSFWSQDKFSNIWAIQHETSVSTDEVEYRDTTPHSTFTDADIGDIGDFTDRWDAAHLIQLQTNWDDDNVDGETSEEKISRLGARPTSYSS
tara:strand:- start:1200 stop:1568 length:369 start_codon:yes stop_codon:yes gene_type:complete